MISPVIIKKDQIRSEYLGEQLINLLCQTYSLPDKFNFKVFKVTSEYIARPDLISLDAYGDTMFSDVICKVNGISNPFELNENQFIILPDPNDIMSFTHDPNSNLEAKDKTNDEIYPTPKSKQGKRKANEAIIGDSRFKIDPNLGIVIY